jgi:uncharacterized RDD family membrane protein YckC
MKSTSPKSFLACSLIVLLCLIALQGIQAFSAALQDQPSPSKPPQTSSTPAVQEESAEQEPPVFQDRLPRRFKGVQVRVGSSQRVGSDETVENMVTIFGSAEMAGETQREMVTVFGNSTVTGEVGRELTTVFGNAKMSGRVRREMVTVFGDVEINGQVDRNVVVVFGSLKLGPNAVLNGDCMTFFGKIDRDEAAVLMRDAVEFLPWLASLQNYIISGPLLGRLLPPGSMLAWIVVVFHFILYFLVAVVLPKPTAAGVRQLSDNFLLCFGVGLLTMILLAPLILILIATGIGILLLPFIGLAKIIFMVLGKTSVLEFFGLQILRRYRSDPDNRPIEAFSMGFLLVTLLYMIPFVGLLVWIVLRPLALGAAVLAVFRSVKRNGNGTSAPGIPVRSTPDNTAESKTPPASPASYNVPPPPNAEDTAQANAEPISPSTASMEFAEPAEPDTIMMQRAGFWIRLAATALDAILLVWFSLFTYQYFLILWLAYHIAMWAWKGTTIGGIICKIKVVRLDGSPVNWGVSLVRSLSSFFSLVILGLGFFWAGWTRNRQSWHDIIAGTVIVRVPQSIALI